MKKEIYVRKPEDKAHKFSVQFKDESAWKKGSVMTMKGAVEGGSIEFRGLSTLIIDGKKTQAINAYLRLTLSREDRPRHDQTTFRSLAELETVWLEWLASLNTGNVVTTAANWTTAKWADEWLKRYEGNRSWDTHESRLRVWVLPVIGRSNLRDVTGEDLVEIDNAVRENNSYTYAESVRTTVRAMFRAAMKKKVGGARLLEFDPTREAEYVKKTSGEALAEAENAEAKAYDSDELQRFLHAVKLQFENPKHHTFGTSVDDNDLCIFGVMACIGGERPSELLAARIREWDGTGIKVGRALKRLNKLQREKTGETYTTGPTKTGAQDPRNILRFPQWVCDMVDTYIDRLEERTEKGEVQNPKGYLLPKTNGEPQDERRLYSRWTRFFRRLNVAWCEDAGVENTVERDYNAWLAEYKEENGKPPTVSVRDSKMRELMSEEGTPVRYLPPYGMRHTCATYLLNEGKDMAFVADRLGHVDATTTRKQYAHVKPEGRQEVVESFGKLDPSAQNAEPAVKLDNLMALLGVDRETAERILTANAG